MAERKVWIVTTGFYSDYQIESIWSREDWAEKQFTILKAARGDDSSEDIRFLEWTLDDDADEAGPREPKWFVEMEIDGMRASAEVQPKNARLYSWAQKQGWVEACVRAKNEQEAIKILNDRRLQFIALGQEQLKNAATE